MHERTGGEGIKRTAFCRIPIAQICGGYLQTEQGDSLAVLADSIARRGLLQPVVVRRTAHGYALICGARRMAACRMLGMEEIDAALIDADDESALLCRLEEHHASRQPHFLSEAHEIAARGGMALAERSALGRRFYEDRIRALALGPGAPSCATASMPPAATSFWGEGNFLLRRWGLELTRTTVPPSSSTPMSRGISAADW